MDRDARTFLRWWVIVALIVVVANMIGCARPVMAPWPKPDTVYVSTPYVPVLPLIDSSGNTIGRTSCDYQGNPAVYVLPRIMQEPTARKYVLAHEGKHVEQALFYGCRAFVARYISDGNFRWEIEASAYCAAYVLMRSDGVAKHEHWLMVIQNMRQYDTSLSDDEIPKYLPCKEAPP